MFYAYVMADVASGEDAFVELKTKLIELKEISLKSMNTLKTLDFHQQGTIKLANAEFKFALVRRGHQYRYDMHPQHRPNASIAYVLDDGKNVFRYLDSGLGVFPRSGTSKEWLDTTHDFNIAYAPTWGGQMREPADWIDIFLSVIDGTSEYPNLTEKLRKGEFVVTCTGADEPEVTRVKAYQGSGRFFLEMWIDVKRGGLLTRYEVGNSAIEPSEPYTDILTCENEYTEVAPSIWLVKTSHWTQTLAGGELHAPGGHLEGGLTVDFMEVGDFHLPDDFFTLNGLPIKKHTHVQDWRTTPSTVFYYGGSVDGEVIDEAVEIRKRMQSGTTTRLLIVSCNVFIFVFLFVWMFARSSNKPRGDDTRLSNP